MDGGREEQRSRLRDEPGPTASRLVLRGGPDTVEKLRRHVLRTARAWSLDGEPLLGFSVFCGLDDLGSASASVLAGTNLITYRWIHTCTVASLASIGVDLLPTGRRPHFTAVVSGAGDDELEAVLVTFGKPHDNRDGRAFDTRPHGRTP